MQQNLSQFVPVLVVVAILIGSWLLYKKIRTKQTEDARRELNPLIRDRFTGSGKTERFCQSARTGATDLSGLGNLAAIRLSPSGTEN